MSHLIDISPPIREGIAVWPGDVEYRREIALDLERGDNLTLSSIHTTVHLGAHADGPNHYRKGAPGIGERGLERYFGPCQVVAVDAERGQRIERRHVGAPVQAARVLFKTGSYPDPQEFNTDFNSFSPELVDQLHAVGVQLVGIDTPSIDPCDDKELRSHARIAAHDMGILEGLVLDHVDPGFYILIALPLRLVEADASPVRAVLLAHGDPSRPMRPDDLE